MPGNFSRRERTLVALCVLLVCAVLFGGRGLDEVSAREAAQPDLFKELKVFTDVLAIVQRDYVQEVPNKQLVEGSIRGLLATLDPHSGYLDPDFYQDLQVQTKGHFGGLGIEITIKDGLLVVVAPMEGSPAEVAGIRAGDAIIKIENKFTKEFSLVDAVKRLRGPVGTKIHIAVARSGIKRLLDFEVTRQDIVVKSVKSRYLEDGLGYIRVSQFMENTSSDLKAAIDRMERNSKRPLRGLILDLRNNPGGLLTQAIRVSDMFLKEGVIVYTEGRIESQKQKFFARGRGTQPDYPLIVLINAGSASASEIVAGALKDHGRALLIGTRTFGKGSVQTITPLENGGALTLTTALYYTKSGRSIQATGVEPDVEIEATPRAQKDKEKESALDDEELQQRLRYRESELEGAIKNPNGLSDGADTLRRVNKTPVDRKDLASIDPEKTDFKTWFARDLQMARAVEMLKNFDIFKAKSQKNEAKVAEALGRS